MNSLYQQLNQQQISPSLNNVRQLKSVMRMVQQSGKSPKEFFYALAKQRGVDPQQILDALK